MLAAPRREVGITATQIKCATPSYELTTSIPREDASWLQGDFAIGLLANPGRMAGRKHRSDPEGGEADAFIGWFDGVRHAAGTRRIDVLWVTRSP